MVSGDDDSALFRRSVGSIKPLTRDRRVYHRKARPAGEKRPVDAPLEPLRQCSPGAWLRPGLQESRLRLLSRSEWTHAPVIDLHGMKAEDARIYLYRTLDDLVARAHRRLLVIHGKGRRSPSGVSILKQLMVEWLEQRPEVLAVAEAAPKDGGSGASYVLLRKVTQEPVNPER